MYIHTLHLVSIIAMGATCQLCPIPLLLTGNARGAGQTGQAEYEVGGGGRTGLEWKLIERNGWNDKPRQHHRSHLSLHCNIVTVTIESATRCGRFIK